MKFIIQLVVKWSRFICPASYYLLAWFDFSQGIKESKILGSERKLNGTSSIVTVTRVFCHACNTSRVGQSLHGYLIFEEDRGKPLVFPLNLRQSVALPFAVGFLGGEFVPISSERTFFGCY